MQKQTSQKLIAAIKKFFSSQKKERAVVGLSGGIDSALVLALLVKALGEQNVTALIMPNTQITKEQNVIDAQNLANKLNVAHFSIEIDNLLHAFSTLPWEQTPIARANLNARVRALILYNFANSTNCLVAGTGNKSEFYMGYFTKYGDGAADFFPIGSLLKKEVRQLALELDLPQEFLQKVPSAELWSDQADEKEMDISYNELDELLPLILEGKKIPKSKQELAKKIKKAIASTEHKRTPAPILT